MVQIIRHGAYGSTIVPSRKLDPPPAEVAEKKQRKRRKKAEAPPTPEVTQAKKPRKPRKPRAPIPQVQARSASPAPVTYPGLEGRASKAPVTQKTYLRMQQRNAKMTGARGKMRHLVAKIAVGARKVGKKSRMVNRGVTRKVFGTKLGRRAVIGVGLAGAAAAAALIIRKRRKSRRSA